MDKIVQIGDEVKFSQDLIKNGVGIVCYVWGDGDIYVGFKEKINSHGWEWEDKGCYEEAKKRGLKYGWWVHKGNYTITMRLGMWKYNDILVNENKHFEELGWELYTEPTEEIVTIHVEGEESKTISRKSAIALGLVKE